MVRCLNLYDSDITLMLRYHSAIEKSKALLECALLCFIVGLNMYFSCDFRYLFGEEVDGMAYVVFGVMQDDKKNSFPSSLQRVEVNQYLHTYMHLWNCRYISNIWCPLTYLLYIKKHVCFLSH